MFQAGNEERKRYSYILDRHCQLLKIYLDTHNEVGSNAYLFNGYNHFFAKLIKAAEPLKIGFAKWSGRINNRTLPEPIPSSYSRTDRAASGIYEELEEMRSRETSELIEDVPSKAEITTNFSSVPQQDKQNFEKFIEDTFKASLDVKMFSSVSS